MTQHIMIDLETFGTGPTAAIIQIGAVRFNPKNGHIDVSGGFENNVSLDSCIKAGLTIDQSTVSWWMGQPDATRAMVMADPKLLSVVLFNLNCWLGYINGEKPFLTIWSHGLSFDLPILENAYRAVGWRAPWDHRVGRDTRTLFWLAQERGWRKPERTVAHTGLADAAAQAEDVCAAYRFITDAA